jgi:hypothetical protein
MLGNKRWRWWYVVEDGGAAVSTTENGHDREEAAVMEATVDAKRRIEDMTKGGD